SREDVVRRINLRVDALFAAVLIEVTRSLTNRGLERNRTATQAIGYRQVLELLRGERSRLETIELVKVRTRQFAKRQLTWFQGQMDLRWLEVPSSESPSETAKRIAALLKP
ncbi:MAG TPA: tRNA (adenosine(37)-N6)-dimethylallyltransferase MiaA, partial [Verrucomicrobiales bacterium]|nr:tRNA (adenosine(37)-N6)-dimethylallyltransferase MiaA [Verrucomicrobiales bacterium]